MAKKRAPANKHPLGLKRTSGLLRHTNAQTFGADASTAIGEAIDNPAFGRGGVHTGMEIARILLIPGKDAVNYGTATTARGSFTTQLQVGDKSGTPALLDPDEESLFAYKRYVAQMATSGASTGPEFPMVIPIINVVPVIVEQYFTVVHEAMNHADFNSEEVFTIVDYFTVEVPDKVYTSIVLSRRDQS